MKLNSKYEQGRVKYFEMVTEVIVKFSTVKIHISFFGMDS